MAERMKAWQCIGCGRLEAESTCIGICQDRPVELVYASDYMELETLVRQLAVTSPREGQWEQSYRALQKRARELLAKR
ncbi:MAG: hypothetical protein EPO20_20835 [Betaproteobacteria bacterium]|nr:MAG: hypothetical protein EPO20_20835 [Betaproteobacteria bacterium]